jgi:hypothetical protein
MGNGISKTGRGKKPLDDSANRREMRAGKRIPTDTRRQEQIAAARIKVAEYAANVADRRASYPEPERGALATMIAFSERWAKEAREINSVGVTQISALIHNLGVIKQLETEFGVPQQRLLTLAIDEVTDGFSLSYYMLPERERGLVDEIDLISRIALRAIAIEKTNLNSALDTLVPLIVLERNRKKEHMRSIQGKGADALTAKHGSLANDMVKQFNVERGRNETMRDVDVYKNVATHFNQERRYTLKGNRHTKESVRKLLAPFKSELSPKKHA